ncbi:hypothetical protein [Actinoplanes sp. L3-i22]|uniref:hypothetical protein n=1 Tax=Actinoplanes sp. L3-i22 TaxID=2836373 RepID=UPI001C76A627|nr:hypothetical protein [Actinoplanes sp. L3-i22]BCY08104.1 hypothetical protein L3i22_031920 [Actinoplanes sp. L3-i22]
MAEPFRWDLIRPDELGSLLDGVEPPDLWFLDALTVCAGKVLARSGDGDPVFVGRSLDSMFDLLSGALDGLGERRLHRLPISFTRPYRRVGPRRWAEPALTTAERDEARRMLATAGVTPYTLARRRRPVTFVDVVDGGGTFTELYDLLRTWIRDERETWPVIRRKVRFVGVTIQQRTSPNTYRWAQARQWTRELPADAVRSVSLDVDTWSYLGNTQQKLTRSLRPDRWLADADGPDRGERTRQALAEAVALVAHGRSRAGRQALARSIGERAQPWTRTLVTDLNAAAEGR